MFLPAGMWAGMSMIPFSWSSLLSEFAAFAVNPMPTTPCIDDAAAFALNGPIALKICRCFAHLVLH